MADEKKWHTPIVLPSVNVPESMATLLEALGRIKALGLAPRYKGQTHHDECQHAWCIAERAITKYWDIVLSPSTEAECSILLPDDRAKKFVAPKDGPRCGDKDGDLCASCGDRRDSSGCGTSLVPRPKKYTEKEAQERCDAGIEKCDPSCNHFGGPFKSAPKDERDSLLMEGAEICDNCGLDVDVCGCAS